MKQDPFKEYLIQTEPDKKDKGYAWSTAIGLQKVDGLEPSSYLIDTAIKNIEGEISFDEAHELLNTYYEQNPKTNFIERTEEADKVSVRIAKLLSEQAFSFSIAEYMDIHKKLFTGIISDAGTIRKFNITKKEWVLDGETVVYGNASNLRETLEYDITQEKNFDYKGLTTEEVINHLAKFISNLWQVHIFPEGNTRTTAVFIIKYLRTLGFQATNDIFANNSWYFRNTLVRANYTNLSKNVYETTVFLETFLRNLLLGENNELNNRTMHINLMFTNSQKPNIESKKPNIQTQKPNIDVAEIYNTKLKDFAPKTIAYIKIMFNEFQTDKIFGRSDVQTILPLGSTQTSSLLKKLTELNIIEPVTGQGKGKYKFQ